MDEKDIKNQLMLEKYEPIAIVGIGLNYPGKCTTVEEFSEFLFEGRSGIVDIPAARWDLDAYFSDDPQEKGKTIQSKGGFVEKIDEFDAKFFNISPKEANYCDPQHRMLLECSWNALESANIDPASLRDTNGGVYVGIAQIDYGLNVSSLAAEDLAGNVGTGTAHSAACGRLSYFLGLRGPCMSIDTACSSSLVALHVAVLGLRRHECNIALCAGVNAIHHPRNHIVFSQSNMLSADGYCKTFDDSADGYSRSEGCGVLVLKRLSDAKRDGDRIFALVRGTAVAQDGESGGLTVPNGIAQTALMRDALKSGLLEPGDIQYVEAHGTGTSLGDPIEVGAINSVFAQSHTKQNPITIASVKSNLGHMEAGAGTCGVIKAALQIYKGLLYPHVNLKKPSRHIPWDDYVVSVPTKLQTWENGRRRAMINSFGFAGSIASVVLEQAPQQHIKRTNPDSNETIQDAFPIFTVSGKNSDGLRLQMEAYRQFLRRHPQVNLNDLLYTGNVSRAHLNARFAASVTSIDELETKLNEYLSEDSPASDKSGEFRSANIAFLFTGQGSQYAGMGKGLYARFAVFRKHIDECDNLFTPYLECSIKALMFGQTQTANDDIHLTRFTQPALFVFEYAMARLWMSWGIKPNILMGHSIGEIVAAVIAGLFTLEDAIKLVATRASLMQSVRAKGGMVAVQAGVNDVLPEIGDHKDVSIGAINAPLQTVISGGLESLEKIKSTLEGKGYKTKSLPVSNGFHSPLMTEISDRFREIFAGITFKEPTISFISNVTGKVATFKEVGQADYWLRHILEPVNFVAGMKSIENRGKHIFVEMGPAPALTNMGKRCVVQREHLWVFSLNPDVADDYQTVQASLAKVYMAGISISWQGYHKGTSCRKIDLPMYVFDRKRYWLPDSTQKSAVSTQSGSLNHALLGPEISNTAANTDVDTREFCASISASYPAYLSDHVVMGQVVFPGAAYVEVLFALQDALFGTTNAPVRDIKIIEPLFLTEDAAAELHTRARKNQRGDFDVEIFSSVEGRDGNIERKHATATIGAAGSGLNIVDTAVEQIYSRLKALTLNADSPMRRHRIEDIYARYSELGLPYGFEFRRILSLNQFKDRVAIGKLRGINTPAAEFLPAYILDCAMQSLAGVVEIDDPYLPVGFDCIQLFKKPKHDLDVTIQLTSDEQQQNELTADIVVTEKDQLVFTASRLLLKRVRSTESRQLFHVPRWFKKSLTSNQLSSQTDPRHVLIVNRAQSEFQSIADKLNDAQITLSFTTDTAAAIQCIAEQQSITDLCWFWQTRTDLSGEKRLRAETELNYKELILLASSLGNLGFGRKLRILLVSEGAQWLPSDAATSRTEDALIAGSLWGFGHVMLNEFPSIQTVMVDLPVPAQNSPRDYNMLLEEWRANVQSEYQVAYRQGIRHVKRIVEQKTQDDREDKNFELTITEYGQFANIKPVAIDDITPTADQVTVAIKASGINFKDVLNALGMLKQYAQEKGIEYKPLPLGFESSGTVVAVGPEAEFKIGDEVIVSQLGCMQKRITVSSDSVVRKPTTVNFEQAAGLSAAYVTAYYSLHNLANIKRGDRVLIHAAAGGVGQAAVQLAKLAGAEIYATASPRKWSLLKSQGVKHVMNSRTLDFTSELLKVTNGKGVDIVLNSLNKDYVPASLKCLGQNGRFVELGKIGIWSAEQMREERPDVDYRNFDLSEFDEQELRLINKHTLQIIVDNLDRGKLSALPTIAYSLEEVEEAFTVLSQGRNVGKLVISFDEEQLKPVTPVEFAANETCLLTGGFGALGKATLRRLATQGARHVTLVTRRQITESELAGIQEDIGQDVQLLAVQGDISNEKDIQKILTQLTHQGLVLTGVIHAAGVLSDGLLVNQSWEGFQRVFEAKVYGTWLLHKSVCELPGLRFFVTYSSISSVFGMPGQSNYAAANSYMDVLMQWRNANSLPGMSINWGPWAEVGMAAELTRQQIKSIEDQGVKFLNPSVGTKALFRNIACNAAQSMVCEFDWDVFQSNRPIVNALLNQVASKEFSQDQSFDLDALINQPKSDRERGIRDILRARVAAVLRYDSPEEVELDAKFLELGLDSLMSVELKNALEKVFKMPFPTSILFDYSDIKSLSNFLADQLAPAKDKTVNKVVSEIEKNVDSAIEDLSDDEADAELEQLQEMV